MDFQPLYDKSAADHDHLCPRQILGVRMGVLGMRLLGFDAPPKKKHLLVIVETDGCFADGVQAATHCTVGHRTLRVEDYGKIAATFIHVVTGQCLRIAPALDIRQQAYAWVPEERRHYFAQWKAYQIMPDDLMFSVTPVRLNTPIQAIISRAGVRVNCAVCGEEIINEREIRRDGQVLCQACAGQGYYQPVQATHSQTIKELT